MTPRDAFCLMYRSMFLLQDCQLLRHSGAPMLLMQHCPDLVFLLLLSGLPSTSPHGPGCAVAVAASLPAALQWCREASRAQQQEGRGVSVLVTGSLYLVGDMLRQLDHAPN